MFLTLKAPSGLLFSSAKCLRNLYNKQCKPRSDAPIGAVRSGSILFASILKFYSNVRQSFAADNFSRRHFSDAFFLGALRVNMQFYYIQRNEMQENID